LLREVDCIAGLVRRSQVADAAQVAILIPPSVDYLVALLACWFVGVPAMPLDPSMTEKELYKTLHAAGVEFVLTHSSERETIMALRERRALKLTPLYVNNERKLLEDESAGRSVDDKRLLDLLGQTDPSTPRAPALVMPSPGGGKFPVLTHQNILASLGNLDSLVWVEPSDIVECRLPLHSMEGIVLGLCLPLLDGASLSIGGPVEDDTTIVIGPAGPPEIGGCPFVAMRNRQSGEWRGILCHVECGGPFAVLMDHETKSFSVAPNLRAEIRDDIGDPVVPGEVGRLHLHGMPVMVGYWRDTESTDEVLTPDNWLDTGIRVRLLGDGTIQFTE
jgi:acyl-CoA synthetase (AMP-forming)/AMP-acid ligase II